jgi:multimeric flavodoxin WrbA
VLFMSEDKLTVMLVCGSPNQNGCTNRALDEIESTLRAEGIDVLRHWIGKGAIAGCQACKWCATHEGKCIFDDQVNSFNEIAQNCDGFIFGSPVYYAGANSSLLSFMTRVFYSQATGGRKIYRMKPAAAISSARRAGQAATMDEINKFFTILEMPVVSSSYWNMVFGSNAEEVEQDEEGLRTMRVLAKNMAYMVKAFAAARNAGIALPESEPPARTNFIR